MASFKVFLGKDTIRRFRTEALPSYEGFLQLMTKLYPDSFHPELKLTYMDSDGDKCTVSSQLEWIEMLNECKDQNVFRIWVSEGDKPYYKDSAQPEVVTVYNDEVKKEPVPQDEWADIPDRVIKALQNLYPGGKILPHHLPSFLESCVTIRSVGEASVDLDVDVTSFNTALHKQAMTILDGDQSKFADAKPLLISQLILNPRNFIAQYNLACVESLLNNAHSAMSSLRKAIVSGYSDLQHMLQDPDLNNIRHLPEFSDLLSSLSNEEVPPYSPRPEESEKPEEKEEMHVDPPVSEPEKEEENPEHTKWESELQIFSEMGFLDRSMLVYTLEKTGGKIDEALADLLG